ncbi:MAG: sodium:sulfate symporter [Rhodospirillaceae bacterium]|nr:sodium:sulfate symporter [Rhodospirillaceae bacterium]HAA93562.1 sodium:sulfate symporter [Rhodospirillaceae bacterium]
MTALFKDPGTIIVAIALGAAGALLVWPYSIGVDPVRYHAGALLLTAIAFWSTHKLPEHVTALILMLGAVLLAVSPPATAFSGFASGGTWLIFGGLVIGAAISESGLDKRMADAVLRRIKLGYGGIISALMILSFALAVVMPGTIPRILVLMPIALALAERMGFEQGSRGANGIAMAVGVGSFFPSWSLLPANLPVVVHIGAIETVYGIAPTYAEHFAIHFPVMGLLRGIVSGTVLYLLFRSHAATVRHEATPKPLDASGRRLAWLLAVTLGFWTTDFLHGVSPAWVGLAAAVILLLPWSGMLSKDAFKSKIDFGPVFYIAGILSIGAIMAGSGLDKWLAGYVIELLEPVKGRDAVNFASILGLGMVASLGMTAPGAPALTVPLAETLAEATGMPLLTVLMAEMTGQSLVLLPYAAPPAAVAIIVGGVKVSDAVKTMFLTTLAAIIVLTPLQYLYWQAIGMFD